MNNEEYVSRMRLEAVELQERISKGYKYLIFNTSDYMLENQLQHMVKYVRVLFEKIKEADEPRPVNSVDEECSNESRC